MHKRVLKEFLVLSISKVSDDGYSFTNWTQAHCPTKFKYKSESIFTNEAPGLVLLCDCFLFLNFFFTQTKTGYQQTTLPSLVCLDLC